MALMSQKDFAALCGVSKKTVTVWKQTGKLVLQGDQVDSDASLAHLEMCRKGGAPVAVTHVEQGNSGGNSGNSQGNSGGNAKAHRPPAEQSDRADEVESEARRSGMSFDEARRIKENYLALLNKLEYQQRSGTLIELVLARGVLFDEARRARDAWLNWPAKVGPRLAAELGIDEADRVTEALTAHVHKQITELGEHDGEFVSSEG